MKRWHRQSRSNIKHRSSYSQRCTACKIGVLRCVRHGELGCIFVYPQRRLKLRPQNRAGWCFAMNKGSPRPMTPEKHKAGWPAGSGKANTEGAIDVGCISDNNNGDSNREDEAEATQAPDHQPSSSISRKREPPPSTSVAESSAHAGLYSIEAYWPLCHGLAPSAASLDTA